MTRALQCLLVCVMSAAAAASELTPGNVVLSFNNQLREFTPTGQLVQTWAIPHPNNPDPGYRRASGVVATSTRNVFVNNLVLATPPSYLSRIDPGTGAWTHVQYDASYLGNIADGDLGILGPYLYNKDGRIDPATGQLTPVPSGPFGRSELSPGQDGMLYAINSGSPQHLVTVYNPADFSIVREFELRDNQQLRLDTRGISALPDGTIYAADWDGRLFRFGPTGTLLQQVSTAMFNFDMLKLSADGTKLVVGSRGGDCGIFRTSDLGLISSFSAGGFGDVYTDFVPVPAPGGAGVVAAATVLAGVRRRRR